MTLLWTLTATFLYAEVVVCILFLLPIQASRWRSLFKSRAVDCIVSYANFYFGFFLLLLLIMFVDAVREIFRFSAPLSNDELKGNPMAENTQHMKLFRAQRNFYIAGFSIFLFVVLRRFVVMINNAAILQADCDASKKQASSATAAAKQLLDSKDTSANEGVLKSLLEKLKAENEAVEEELRKTKLNLDAVKQQSASNNKQFDNLLKEHEVLQRKLVTAEGGSSKKDE